MAVFLDLENIALGALDAHYPKFDIQKVLERLLLKGHIVVKKAYCDFDRYKAFKRDLHEAAFELIEIPHVRQSGKNSADIRMVVDALDLCYMKSHVDTFVIISGDSDFSPLVSKLRENAKTVIGVGVKNSTSDLFISNCDQFLYYDDLVRPERARMRPRYSTSSPAAPVAPRATTIAAPITAAIPTSAAAMTPLPAATAEKPASDKAIGDKVVIGDKATTDKVTGDKTTKVEAAEGESKSQGPTLAQALDQVLETLDALMQERDEDDLIWASMIKQAIKRRNPGFNERAHGFRSFNDLLMEAQKRGLVKMEADQKSGGYTVRAVD